MKNKKAIVLLSGGIDSTTTLYWAKDKGYYPYALIFDYNQRHRKEITCALKIAEINRLDYYLVKIDISWANSALTSLDISVPKNRDLHQKCIPITYVPARNIIFLSYAFSLAESIKASTIFIGAHTQDYSGYPDCREEFLSVFQKAANLGMKENNIRLRYPLIKKNKKQIIKMGLKLKVPFEYTWSCYEGKDYPCGKCDSCQFRISAFESLGLTDPLLKNKK